jgi:hypothetical protein
MTDPRIPDDDPRLRELLARLPDSQEPARDLWPEIRARVEAERVQALPVAGPARRSGRMIPLRLAAVAAVALVMVTATLTWWSRPSVLPMAVDSTATAIYSFASYERSAEELSTLLAQRSAKLDPATREVLERSLRTIEEALAEARAALDREPANAEMRAFVEAAWRQKLDFLRRANDVAATWVL